MNKRFVETTGEWKSAECLECGETFQSRAEAQAHREGPCGYNVIELYGSGTEWLFRLYNNS